MRSPSGGANDRDIKVKDVFTQPELLVKSDRGIISVVGLNIDDPRAALGSDDTEALDQPGSYALATVRLVHR
jgi:hypothetical protein